MERAALAIGIFEIPLQFDKYFGFQIEHAELGAVAGINVSITLIAFAVLYFLWFARRASVSTSQLKRWIFGPAMIAYVAFVTLSVATAEVQFLAVCDWFIVVQAYALFFYVANRIDDYRDLLFTVMVLAGTLVFQCFLVYGLSLFGEAGEIYKYGALTLKVWEDGRPAGTMHSAVLAGSVMAFLWLPVMGLTLSSASPGLKKLAIAALAIGLLGIMLTQTRGAIGTTFVGACVIGFAAFLRGWLPRQAITITALLGLISIVPLITVIQGRILSGDGGSAVARKHLTVIAIQMIKDRPLLGYGAGNCHLAGIPRSNAPEYRSEWYYTIHCKYLLTWIENGVFGFLAFLCVIGTGIRYGMKTWFTRNRMYAPIGLALALGIAGNAIHMLVDIFNSRTQVQILWIVLGLVAATYRLSQSKPSDSSRAQFTGALSHGR